MMPMWAWHLAWQLAWLAPLSPRLSPAAVPARFRGAVLSAVSSSPRIVRVRHVPFEARSDDVQSAVECFGEIEHVWLAPWGRPAQGTHRGHGRITFASGDAASDAIRSGALSLLGGTMLLEEEEQQLSEPRKKQRARISPQRRQDLLEALDQSRSRDHRSNRDYQRFVQSKLAQLGRLRNAGEYSIAVGAACRSRDPSECLRLLRTAKLVPSVRSFDAAISACIGPARWRAAVEVLEMMPKGMPTVTTYSLATRACAKAGRLGEASRMLKSIDISGMSPERRSMATKAVLNAYNSALDAAGKQGRWREAQDLLERLRNQVAPSAHSFLAATTACANLPADKTSSRVGAWRLGDPSMEAEERAAAALALLREMSSYGLPADARCYNAALRACALQRDPSRGLSVRGSMREHGLKPDALTYAAAISCCSRDEAEEGWSVALSLLEEMKSEGVAPDLVTYGAAIAACSAAARWKEAVEVLDSMEAAGVTPDVVCYSSCISALGRGDRCDEALGLLSKLEQHATVRPNTIAYNAAISACERSGRWVDALRLFESMRSRGAECAPNTVSLNAAISACEKGGQWQKAMELLEGYGSETSASSSLGRDAASYTAAMSALSTSARLIADPSESELQDVGERARGLLERIEAAGIRPDAATYNAAISALEKAGQWQGALELYRQMSSRHGLSPNVVTFNALMQALGAAGRVAEGFELLEEFDEAGYANTTWSYSVHRTLLQACRANGTTEQVERVQAAMTRRGLSAVAPVARASSNGESLRYTNRHRFTSSVNGTASEVGRAARELWTRVARSRRYKPTYEALPYGFTRSASRPEMVRSLQGHAEKLALADLLRRAKERGGPSAPDAEPLELSINFKVCADCHGFFKAASSLIGQPITVREPKVTHSFSAGECSCGDRWRWEARRRMSA